ncbi:MAG: glycosyltransferase family 4 protein [Candidatus Nanoarchaeia archaeon]|nr:glycosyltransferase family 4 protein [Candidatus Nanoarchaeia archaeon]MDD5741074.1 glycosyltransferase family 4 protein [Candidatus Nanoarchaeia archaeon]
MKCLVLFPYPTEADGVSLQGELLYRGLLKAGAEAIPCHPRESIQKEFYLRNLNLDFAIGIGFWGNVPEIIQEPLKFGVTPIPWFNADGWVANYKEEFNKLKLMFTTSQWVKSIYERDGVDVSKIMPMHIGIDTDLFKPMENTEENKKRKLALRRMFGVRDNEKMILTMGGDVTSKGAQEMFRALAEVDKEFKDWKYICKSWPSDCASEWREKEEQLVDELGIGDKVVFIDDAFSQEFMAEVINCCDIYAAPSRIEGFGMIQVEAMACGKPVISINVGGPAETIIHNKTGFLAKVAEEIKLNEEWAYPSMGFVTKQIIKFNKPKTFAYRADINDLKEYTLKLLTDEELCKKMGKAGRQHVVNNLDYRVTSKKMLDVIKEKLGLK